MLDCRLLYGVIPQNKVSPPPGVGTLFEFNHISLRSLVIVEFVTGEKSAWLSAFGFGWVPSGVRSQRIRLLGGRNWAANNNGNG